MEALHSTERASRDMPSDRPFLPGNVTVSPRALRPSVVVIWRTFCAFMHSSLSHARQVSVKDERRSGIDIAKEQRVMPMQTAAHPSAGLRDLFSADHEELEDLFGALLDAFEANDRQGVALLWTEFDVRLTQHLAAEERFVLPQLFVSCPRDARTIMEEHRHIRSRLSELRFGVDLHTVRLETARGFVDELRAHARHEDGVLYRWAEEHLAAIDRTAVLSKLTPPRMEERTG